MKIYSFSQAVVENLKSYVYLLINPKDDEVFYVGKGQGNRVFDHLLEANANLRATEKLEEIRGITLDGKEVICRIHRHGLTPEQAIEVEASLIDFIKAQHSGDFKIGKLTNVMGGYHGSARGHMTVARVVEEYDAPKAEITEPVILITINKLYWYGMDERTLYESTRASWKVNPHRHKPKYAFAVFRGIVRQVYEIKDWYRPHDNPGRYAFNGKVAEDMQHYVGKSVADRIGAQNPIKYVNC